VSVEDKFPRGHGQTGISRNPWVGLDLALLTREAARILGARGGAATKGVSTPAKRRSSRENGKKGGRPKKTDTSSAVRTIESEEKVAKPLATSTVKSSARGGLPRRRIQPDQVSSNAFDQITDVRVGRPADSLFDLLRPRPESSSELGGQVQRGSVMDGSRKVGTISPPRRAAKSD